MRRQVVELPVMKPVVIEYRLHALCCRRCGTMTRGEPPSDAPRLGFGALLCAMVALLSGKPALGADDAGAAQRRVQLDAGLGPVSNIEREMSRAIPSAVEVARTHVRDSPVVHPDETSWRQRRRNAWFWTAAKPAVTVFRIDRSRGSGVARELLGGSFDGIAVSNRCSGLTGCRSRSGRCAGRHLRRDFQEIVDRHDEG